MATGDEDFATWEDNGIGEGTLVPHRVDVLDGDDAVGTVERYDVGIGGGLRGLVAGCAPDGKDLALCGIVHDCVTTHGVGVIASGTCPSVAACTSRTIPVHVLAGASLEDVTILPAKEPTVVV